MNRDCAFLLLFSAFLTAKSPDCDLAKRGRFDESEAMFDQAAHLAPHNAKIVFESANTYIHQQRNLEQAKRLLKRYTRAQLTPDDPPWERAASLLKKIGA